ncbi:YtzI protein [Bacillus sp. AGMB 02131]|uniref:YtzI protein n=1 Tax=Peribacillus faecalis TaxID=2772559 RepID=A0A927D2W0_9BACI|nr:YtzI protein [Peribacillus faecalis]MBD3110545.1 YtzI protein [Peribacillus faecalis]
MTVVLIISIIIIFAVIILAAVTTTKAYQFKHTVDPIDNKTEERNQNQQ